MTDLILDRDSNIRDCPANHEKLGYWRTRSIFFSYKGCSLEVWDGILDAKEPVLEALAVLFNLAIGIVLLPVLPFVMSFFQWRRSCKVVEREKLEKAVYEEFDKERLKAK